MSVGRAAVVALALLAPVVGAGAEGNFSQHPGFAAYFRAHPPTGQAASPAERRLLAQHRPRFYLAEGEAGPIDFYRDYVGSADLVDGAGRPVEPVDREALVRLGRDPGAVLTHRPRPPRHPPVAYASIEHATVPMPYPDGTVTESLRFLTYHLAFAHSGLPAGLGGVAEALISLVGDPGDWHQLDHYTAATVVIDADARPIALVLQQHNYQRTYLVGETVAMPDDGRLRVDVARRSNELYPHRSTPTRRRAVRFTDPAGWRYLLGGGSAPLASADDLTHGQREVGYGLEFLADTDPFYLFHGYLGGRRALPGRDGPPGAAYNTWPAHKPWAVALFLGYWRDDHAGDLERLERTVGAGGDYLGFARAQAPVLAANLRCLRNAGEGCRLR
ncbi:MAG: hypothetical protein H6983_21315 [Ectothiorhodospiraceae bacterium]|nr:hypothetical protein [Chromatiales bacterium]MCP5156729.1 hypothetical protein [Ectothiorhodospiraceae bacterium]